jgi:Protein of unknown function (DUF1552)
MKSFNLNRRAMLRGAGTAMALPLLEAMLPVGKTAFAQSAQPARFLGYFTSCGIRPESFNMAPGPIGTLSRTLTPFEALKNKITMVRGVAGPNAGPGGDHARGCHTLFRAGAAGASVDQLAHQSHMLSNDKTRFGSLAVGINGGCSAQDGAPPPTLCAVSWENTDNYKPKDSNPGLLFDKLFAGFVPTDNSGASLARKAMDESVLSSVKDDARKLQAKIGATDKQVIEQYFTSIEELETRIKAIPVDPGTGASCAPGAKPNPATIPERAKALSDLVVLAFQCDLARYGTFMLENGGDYVTYTHLQMPDGHHQLSHSDNLAAVQRIDQWMMEEMAYLATKMDAVKDVTGKSLLDSCSIIMSNEVSNGQSHSHADMPCLIVGGCNGYFKMGQVIQGGGNMGSVWVSVLEALGHPRAAVGNSNGPMNAIKA